MLELVAVGLVDAGGAIVLAGLLCLVKPLGILHVADRRTAALVLGAGVVIAVVGFALPSPLVSVDAPRTRLDAVCPSYQFHEVHTLRVHASPARVLQAVHDVTAGEIRLFRTLTWIRSPRVGPRRESILNAPEDKPILDVALRSGFVPLGDEPGRELVVGTVLRFGSPGVARGVMNFRADDETEGWSLLSTETRVFATDDSARRRFALYWRIIYPGSAFIRRMWLQAIKRRAEAPA